MTLGLYVVLHILYEIHFLMYEKMYCIAGGEGGTHFNYLSGLLNFNTYLIITQILLIIFGIINPNPL